MNIKERLKVEIKPDLIEFQPNRGSQKGIIILASVALGTIIVAVALADKLGVNGKFFTLGIIAYCMIHGLVELIFRVYVRIVFDRKANIVYRLNPVLGEKRLMKLDEMVIFKQYESGDWYYAIGIKKKQFLKSYRISPDFRTGKKGQKMAEAFENEIMPPVTNLLYEQQMK